MKFCPECGSVLENGRCPQCDIIYADNSTSNTQRSNANENSYTFYDPDAVRANINNKDKTKTCKHCGAQIAKDAKTCPKCGGKTKKPIYKRVWFWVIIVLLILIGAIDENDSSDESKKVSSSTEYSSVKEPSQTQIESNPEAPVIDEVVVYEGNDVIITATEIKKSGSDWAVNLLIENNSSLNLGFNAHAYAINGIMTRNNIYSMDCDVAAGKKANATLLLKGSVIKEYGIQDIRCIDALLWAYDNDKLFKEFDTDQFEIKTSLYDGTHDSIEGTTIFDEDGIKVDYLSSNGDNYNFCITNTTGSYLDFDFNEITINDFTNSEIDFDLYDEEVLNNCQIVVSVNVSNKFKELNTIDSVETLEWNMAIRPNGDYFQESKIGPVKLNLN